MKIFLLNGPPGSGKDTAAEQIHSVVPNSRVMKFATPLKDAACALYCSNDRQVFDSFDHPEVKNLPSDQFMGFSCRQVQINLSETFLKIHHGQDVFGRILAERIRHEVETNGVENFFISDSGFLPEAEVIISQFGAENVNLIRLHRGGYDFTGDSRGYINLDHLGVKSVDFTNVEGNAQSLHDDVQVFILGVI